MEALNIEEIEGLAVRCWNFKADCVLQQVCKGIFQKEMKIDGFEFINQTGIQKNKSSSKT